MSEELTLQTRLLHLVGDACLTLDDLANQSGHSRHQVSAAMAKLVSRGLVSRVERGCFEVTAEGRSAVAAGKVIKAGPRGAHSGRRSAVRDTLRQRAWNAMRLSRRFTVRDIAMVATRGGEGDPVENVSRFFRELQRAGYLQRVGTEEGTAPTSNGFARYALVRDTGHRVPVYSAKHRALRDFNTGEDVPCS